MVGEFERIVNLAVDAAKKQEPFPLHSFHIVRTAGTLIKAAKDCEDHHRKREQHYTKELEKAETRLKNDGVTIEAYNTTAGYLMAGRIASGKIEGYATNFQPKIDQDMMDAVKRAKSKMLEHRDQMVQYGKYAKAFTCSPQTKVELSVEDIHFFRLEG